MINSQNIKLQDLELFCRKGVGPVTYRKYLEYEKSDEFSYELFNSKYPIDKSLSTNIVRNSFEYVTYRGVGYPQLLKETADSPIVLFFKGNIELLKSTQIISVAGTRMPTDYGKSICKDLIKSLHENTVVVVGLALGVDTIIAEECIKNNINLIGVLPANIKNIIPNSNKALVDKIILNRGLILWENPLQQVTNGSFVQRNRIIAGLSKYLIIVEADEKSGSITTADFAFDYDRDIYAVPGKIYSSKSRGTNALIRDNKAKILTHFSDLPSTKSKNSSDILEDLKIDNIERNLYYAILDEPKSLDDLLSLASDYSILTSKLLNLEILGYIKKGHDGKYRKV